ncbi:hypothetical protein WA026_017942 [Henosepilachna vigintioctopunctata]|uniref:Uncharacterized protein n=1 Tax=Henosepilachna vigintioctopunctata TaxID=420089 RepID=A0AAW1TZD3_9CUCU
MGWLDSTPSRAIPPPRDTEHSVLGWDMLQAFSTRLLDLVNLGIGRPSEIRALFASIRIPAVARPTSFGPTGRGNNPPDGDYFAQEHALGKLGSPGLLHRPFSMPHTAPPPIYGYSGAIGVAKK